MTNVVADYKRFNANSKQRNAQDCVCRAVSLAFGMEYDAAHRMLLAWGRDCGSSHKYFRVFKEFLTENNCTYTKYEGDLNVDEFCESHPTGTYILVGGFKRLTEHAICVIDGDYWDTFDSGAYRLCAAFEVHGRISGTSIDIESSLDSLKFEMKKYLTPYVEFLMKRMPYCDYDTFWHKKSSAVVFSIRITFPRWEEYNLPRYYTRYEEYGKDFVISLNPRMTLEDNIESQKSRMHVAVREYLYQLRRECELDIKRNTIEINPKFKGSRSLLMKLPDECIPYITYLLENSYTYHADPEDEDYDGVDTYRYEMQCEALPEDPRAVTDDTVMFYADNFTELKQQLKKYWTSYDRFDYDY